MLEIKSNKHSRWQIAYHLVLLPKYRKPKYAPATLVKLFKGITARKLFKEFPELKKEFRKGHLWTSSYYLGTAGNVSADTIKRYIQEC